MFCVERLLEFDEVNVVLRVVVIQLCVVDRIYMLDFSWLVVWINIYCGFFVQIYEGKFQFIY